MIGFGLLEAVAEKDILAYADPEDEDGDGVSGRPNRVWSVEYDEVKLGRKRFLPSVLTASVRFDQRAGP